MSYKKTFELLLIITPDIILTYRSLRLKRRFRFSDFKSNSELDLTSKTCLELVKTLDRGK